MSEIDFTNWVDCWNCDQGYVANCFEEYACVDPESGCNDCRCECDICHGKGGWDASEQDTATSPPSHGGDGRG